MPSRSRRKKSSNQNQNHNQNEKAVLVEVTDGKKLLHHHHSHEKQASVCFEGHRLSTLLDSFHREIQYERNGNKVLPEKLWFKQHFAVGVNEVTRVLERMPPSIDGKCSIPQVEDFPYLLHQVQRPAPCSSATRLQVVLVASDCNPRWLTKHLLSLASSRNVPLIYVKDEREGSLRLGELVKVKTAIALGVKVKGSSINRLVERVYSNDLLNGRLDDDCTL